MEKDHLITIHITNEQIRHDLSVIFPTLIPAERFEPVLSAFYPTVLQAEIIENNKRWGRRAEEQKSRKAERQKGRWEREREGT